MSSQNPENNQQNQPPITPELGQENDVHNSIWRRRAVIFAVSTVAFTATASAINTATDTKLPHSLTFGESDAETKEIRVPGETRSIRGEVTTETSKGPSVDIAVPAQYAADFQARPLEHVEQTKITAFAKEIDDILANPETTGVELTVFGSASDESTTDSQDNDANIGRPSANNKRLADQRADIVAQIISEKYADEPRISVTTKASEDILNSDDINKLDAIAAKTGTNRQQLIRDYNQGKLKLSTTDIAFMSSAFDSARYATITSQVKREIMPTAAGPCDIVQQVVQDPDTVTKRYEPADNGWVLTLIPGIWGVAYLARRKKSAETTPDSSEPDHAKPRNNADKNPYPRKEGTPAAPVGGVVSETRDVSLSAGRFSARTRSLKALKYVLPLAIIPFLPIPGCDTDQQDKPDIPGQCRTIDYAAAKSVTPTVITPVEVVNNIRNDRSWNDGAHRLFSVEVQRPTTTVTYVPHRVITVNKAGKIQQIEKVPTKQVKLYDHIPPRFIPDRPQQP